MKYFLDTEFHEYQKKPLFGKPIDTIELISIGIVSEEYKYATKVSGRSPYEPENVLKNKEYYAICKEFDLKAAWNNKWLRENVLKFIWMDFVKKSVGSITPTDSFFIGKPYTLKSKLKTLFKFISTEVYDFNFKAFKYLLNKYGKTRKQIAEEVIDFIAYTDYEDLHPQDLAGMKALNEFIFKPEFYGYYSDYDWVVFCWLFGRMIDLPKGFPMYCKDLQQIKNEKVNNKNILFPKECFVEDSCKFWLDITKHKNYPKQTNEHNALADAKWNYELFKFLKTL